MRISNFKPIALGIALLAVFAVGSGEAKADEVHIAGFTNGCFGAACVPGASATILGLTYSNSTFAGTTAAGSRALGGNANPGSNFNNLGSLTLSTAPNTYDTTFSLQVTFLAPQGIAGTNQALFTATVTGTVVSDNIGGVMLDFNNTPILFTFIDPNCEPDPTGGIPGQQTTCGTGSFFFFHQRLGYRSRADRFCNRANYQRTANQCYSGASQYVAAGNRACWSSWCGKKAFPQSQLSVELLQAVNEVCVSIWKHGNRHGRAQGGLVKAGVLP